MIHVCLSPIRESVYLRHRNRRASSFQRRNFPFYAGNRCSRREWRSCSGEASPGADESSQQQLPAWRSKPLADENRGEKWSAKANRDEEGQRKADLKKDAPELWRNSGASPFLFELQLPANAEAEPSQRSRAPRQPSHIIIGTRRGTWILERGRFKFLSFWLSPRDHVMQAKHVFSVWKKRLIRDERLNTPPKVKVGNIRIHYVAV